MSAGVAVGITLSVVACVLLGAAMGMKGYNHYRMYRDARIKAGLWGRAERGILTGEAEQQVLAKSVILIKRPSVDVLKDGDEEKDDEKDDDDLDIVESRASMSSDVSDASLEMPAPIAGASETSLPKLVGSVVEEASSQDEVDEDEEEESEEDMATAVMNAADEVQVSEAAKADADTDTGMKSPTYTSPSLSNALTNAVSLVKERMSSSVTSLSSTLSGSNKSVAVASAQVKASSASGTGQRRRRRVKKKGPRPVMGGGNGQAVALPHGTDRDEELEVLLQSNRHSNQRISGLISSDDNVVS